VDVPLWAWAAFVAFIVVLLAVDLAAHRRAHVVSTREAALWSAVWVLLGLGFAGVLWAWQGATAAGQYLAGFLIEKSLAVDNIFVFALLFTYFAVPREYRHRVLFYGVLGALVFRAAFIAAGATLLEAFHVTIYVFGAFLVLTGVKMARSRDHEVHPERNPVLRLVRRVLPMTDRYAGQRFWVRQGGRWVATPLFAVLVAVETTDVIFAVDSIPAIFAVTSEPFLVFTSNAFAILGLRALYFLLEGMLHRFAYLKLGLSAVLVFVGAKMLASDLYKVDTWISLGVIATIIAASVWASLRRKDDGAVAKEPTDQGAALNPGTREDGHAQTPTTATT
jgi:tellurite resistance protein TerC